MRRIVIGVIAHVDSGKTTLSESLLFKSGTIRKAGRVDNKDAFLDTNELERQRGITIFSKQAVMEYEDISITLLDTPGHIDFSAEMERTLWALDYAVLVVSGADGVQGHTLTLWRLLERYHVPTFLFVNKMDQLGTNKEALLEELQKELSTSCVDFSSDLSQGGYEEIAVCDDNILERYLEGKNPDVDEISTLIKCRKLFPCYFGSALKMQGIDELLKGFHLYLKENTAINEFGAKVFKIDRDNQGNRLTYLKITSGILRVKDVLTYQDTDGLHNVSEKVNQIRIYSGDRYETVLEAYSGMCVAVTGLSLTKSGCGIGTEIDGKLPVLEPVLSYKVNILEDMDAAKLLPLLKQLEEEEPELHIVWQESTGSILIKLMGEVQIEVLQKIILERFGVAVSFGRGSIVYKETIANTVEGVGHFEPLKHYAEVHLLLEPGEEGSGLQFETDCSEDVLDKNWQRLILTHLEEKEHLGVLTGSAITDMKITVVGGRAHTKHTEGGDFRQATYRAVRQGLMQAESVLLEPYYHFRLDVPADTVGRAMTDIENMAGRVMPPSIESERAVLEGDVPVATIRDYQIQVNSYTKGRGSLSCVLKGYGPCHNTEEVLESISYNAKEDVDNPSSSVFYAHGAGFIVPWDEVANYMHVESTLLREKTPETEEEQIKRLRSRKLFDYSIDEEQIAAIMNKTFYANEKESKHYNKKQHRSEPVRYKSSPKPRSKDKYLIVDGYNIVHAWEDLSCLIDDNLDGARMKLMDILCNYQAFTNIETIVVFDAYKVKGNLGEMFDYHNIHVVYTKEAETADSYIEKLTHRISKDYQVTVATSDGLVQLITRGQNCAILSAREFALEIENIKDKIKQYMDNHNSI